jgi:acetylornithine aminotransferase
MMTNDIINDYNTAYFKVFGTPQLSVLKASGSVVYDTDNKEYIDFLGGIAVNVLGHANQELADALYSQALTVSHVSNFFTTENKVSLAKSLKTLADLGEGSGVFFTNSGTESIEAALKIVKKHGGPNGKILALTHSFHGRSLGALSITHKPQYRQPFAPLIPNVEFIEPTIADLEDVFATPSTPIAGVFIECIQGEAGVKPVSSSFIKRARELTRENNALLVIDEVQTGVGRTGKWFAFEHVLDGDNRPDIVTLAKGLGGGFPIGAVIANKKANETLVPGNHGTTFGGNPLAMSVAEKVLEIIERDDL